MKHIKRTRYGKQTIARDAHDPTKVFVETVTNDVAGVELNKKIRSAGLMKTGQRNPLGPDGAEVTTSFQFPTQMAYQITRKKYPDLFDELEQGGEAAVRAGEKLALLVPEYVTSIRRGDRLNAR